MPELTTMSITVMLAPRVRGGLHALLGARLADLAARHTDDPGGGTVNQVNGNVTGTLIQARDVSGGINIGNNPFWRR